MDVVLVRWPAEESRRAPAPRRRSPAAVARRPGRSTAAVRRRPRGLGAGAGRRGRSPRPGREPRSSSEDPYRGQAGARRATASCGSTARGSRCRRWRPGSPSALLSATDRWSAGTRSRRPVGPKARRGATHSTSTSCGCGGGSHRSDSRSERCDPAATCSSDACACGARIGYTAARSDTLMKPSPSEPVDAPRVMARATGSTSSSGAVAHGASARPWASHVHLPVNSTCSRTCEPDRRRVRLVRPASRCPTRRCSADGTPRPAPRGSRDTPWRRARACRGR